MGDEAKMSGMDGTITTGREAAPRNSFGYRRLAEIGLFAVLPPLLTVGLLVLAWQDGLLAFDLVHFELPAAEKVAHGDSPYPGYGYPPLVAFALVPLVWIPGADVIATVLLTLSVPAILWLLDVRDWRCYGAALLWAPVFHAIQTANVTLPIMLFAALAWRFRDRLVPASAWGGTAVALKILAWPIGVFFVATRRWSAGVGAAAATLAITLGLWAILGFDGLLDYPDRVQDAGRDSAAESFTLTVLLTDYGAPRIVGRVVAVAVALLLLAACLRAGRRAQERQAFALATAAFVFASPIVWLHSFSFLLLGVAVMRPRLSLPWLLPIPMLLSSGTGNGERWQTTMTLLLGLAVVATTVLGKRVAGYDSDMPRTGSRVTPRDARPA